MPYGYNGTYDRYEYYKIEDNAAIPIKGSIKVDATLPVKLTISN